MSLAEAVRPTVPAWRAWLHIARVSNTPTVVSNAVAGALLASTAAETGTVALVALAMALFYTAGMVLNDLADAEVDRRERPERPIPSGAISPAAALAAFCALVAAGLAILATEDVGPLLAGIALFDALAVASVEGAAAAVGVCLAAFLATIGLQTRISGT